MANTIHDSVALQRGLGYAGRRVQIVHNECEICGYDRLLKEERVFPEDPPEITYYCRHPNCPDHKSASRIIPSI